jgi:HAD superfamily hydrolase (TIGR01549 family)
MLFEKPRMQYGSLPVLKSLHKKGKKIAIFSNGSSWRIEREIKDLSIDHYFSSRVSAQHIGSLKPNPLGIHLIMRKCDVARRRTLYIGDMVDDIKTARAAGVDSCGIAAGFDNYTALEDERPTYLFRDMREFHKAL